MIKTYEMLLNEYMEYEAVDHKISRLAANNDIIKLRKGLYETDPSIPGHLVANAIYGPSYLSFDYALAYHGLIPEAVYAFTSATFRKGKRKKYKNYFGNFYYRDIPDTAYPYEILLKKERGYYYQIASAEKALCDKLYSLKPIKNQKELIDLLFLDLRIDEDAFLSLDKTIIQKLISLYPSTNLKLLGKVLSKYE